MLALFHAIAARLRGFFRLDELESDFDEEMAAHLRMAEEDGLHRGLTAEEARRTARVQLGGITQLRESSRAVWGFTWLNGFALDAKIGLRMLRRSWGITLAGGLAMTIVITIAAVAFVFLDEFMGRTAPPLDEGERVVALQNWDAEAHLRQDVSRRDLDRWGSTLRSVVDLGGFQTIERQLMIEGRPAEWVRLAEMSASGFRLARVQPLLGRWFSEADERAGAAPVVVIGYDVWQSRFDSDRVVIGKTVRLNDAFHTVVGVMPEGFAFPVNHHYWTPLRPDAAGSLKASPDGVVFARLAPGVTQESAQAELSVIGLLPQTVLSGTVDPRLPRIVPYTFAFTDDVEPGELAWQQRIILLLVSLLLVPPCLNIAILIYARTVTRQEEFAVRFALGANRTRIVAQLCVEVLVLSSVAGIIALALTRPILTQIGEIIRRFPDLGGALPFWVTFDFSWRAALFVGGLSVMAALLAGLLPALQATGRVLPSVLRSLSSRTGVPLGATWTTLIVAQVALALAVLPSTIELAWGHLRPAVLGPGFAANEFLTARIAVKSKGGQATEMDRTAFATRVRDIQAGVIRQIEAEAGESTVTVVSAIPGAESMALVEMDNGDADTRIRRYVKTNQVDQAFFSVLDVRALAGRTFDGRDFGVASTVVVDQIFVRELFGDGNPLGRRVRPVSAPGAEPGPWFEIVGVVPERPANTSQGRLYFPAKLNAGRPASVLQLLLHAGPDPAAMVRRLHEIGTSLDPALRIEDVRRLDEVLRETQTSSNLTSYILVVVMLSVLLLSAAGLYALMSFTVTRRRREIGIRMALGAPPGRMLAGIFAHVLWQIGAGVAVGTMIALLLHFQLNIEVEGGWHIPGILPAAALFVMMIGILSATGPARRAVRVAPMEALKDG